MKEEFWAELKKLFQAVVGREGSFYRKLYSKAGLDESFSPTPDNFASLPVVTGEILAGAPYPERVYGESSGLNKLVYSDEADRYFLIHRTLEEVKAAALFISGKRPLVLRESVYEAIEHCLYFYEHNVLPLIGEIHNPAVVLATARQYSIDSMVTDHSSVVSLGGELLKLNLPLKEITAVGDVFYSSDFDWLPGAKKKFNLSLPEPGPLGYSCPKSESGGQIVLHPYADVFIEPGALAVVTSVRLKACPVIRYRAPLYLEEISKICGCEAKHSFVF